MDKLIVQEQLLSICDFYSGQVLLKFWLLKVFRVLDIIDCSKFSFGYHFYGFAFNTSFHMYGNHCTVSDLNGLMGNDRIPIELLKVISFRMSFPTFYQT